MAASASVEVVAPSRSQPYNHRLKPQSSAAGALELALVLVGAQPAESPEGHDAVLPGPGVAGKRLHVLTEYDQQGSHCSSPGSDHALATHRRRWGFEQLRDVRGPTRQETRDTGAHRRRSALFSPAAADAVSAAR